MLWIIYLQSQQLVVKWLKSLAPDLKSRGSSRNPGSFSILFICFIYFLPTSKLNDNKIITYKKFLIRCSNEKILCDDFKTSTKNLTEKEKNKIRLQPPFVPIA